MILWQNLPGTELSEIKRCHLDFVSASKINIDENGHKLGTYINDFSPEQMKNSFPLITVSITLP